MRARRRAGRVSWAGLMISCQSAAGAAGRVSTWPQQRVGGGMLPDRPGRDARRRPACAVGPRGSHLAVRQSLAGTRNGRRIGRTGGGDRSCKALETATQRRRVAAADRASGHACGLLRRGHGGAHAKERRARRRGHGARARAQGAAAAVQRGRHGCRRGGTVSMATWRFERLLFDRDSRVERRNTSKGAATRRAAPAGYLPRQSPTARAAPPRPPRSAATPRGAAVPPASARTRR